MSLVEVNVPDIGGASDVDIIEICVKPGDNVTVDQSLIVLESDKATMEIPSPQSGVVDSLLIKVGDKVSEGHPILTLRTAEKGAMPQPTAAESVAVPVNSEVRVPDIGAAKDVTVIEVLVKAGDEVNAEQSLIVLESDKATMEIPAPFAGRVTALSVAVGDKVNEGDVIARVSGTAPPASKVVTPIASVVTENRASTETGTSNSIESPQGAIPPQLPAQDNSGKVHAGPAVRKLAREFGVDLGRVSGSGPKGRISKTDLQSFVKAGMQQLKSGAGSGFGLPSVNLPDFTEFGTVERRPMSRIHRATAENMVRSWLTVPHVTQFDEADITDLEAFRQSQKAVAEKKGIKLSPLPFIVKACAYALEMYPQFNVSLDIERSEVIQKRYVHIGVAVDTPAGLVVPVIRDANRKGIWELASEMAELSGKARDKKLKPGDMQGGCFSISSLGSIGGTAFTPIVNTPEVAILGVSKASMKPWYSGEAFVPRLFLPLKPVLRSSCHQRRGSGSIYIASG
jgi:pyruvate dehydrogenase E2 component (dihydrolipoamide acetyltransferase)